ncbi:preprotein translocase subunit SecD [Pedobacter frigidisoli]|uniref:preprotein translocase subunit SecD n=1 Tax=Pedobacter frigidisoli TaxID=2530455 RepID=UPI002930CC9F|nr:preprotein translocase subunit SecD [Pedobacter frigidisoli]
MKKIFAFAFIALMAIKLSFAQSSNKEMDYKEVSGRYGSNEGICLFEDGEFMLYGYATAVFGRYSFNKNELNFYPDRSELFEVYATLNKSIGDSTKINFVGFDGRSPTFIRFAEHGIHQVFNEDANCFDGPFVYQLPHQATTITLYGQVNRDLDSHKVAYTYQNRDGYNDFILAYSPGQKENEDFNGIITKEGKLAVIKLSNYGGDTGYFKNKADEDEQKQWMEILEMKEQYHQSKIATQNGVLANKHYQTFLRNEGDYHFDQATYLYTSKTAPENDEYFLSSPFSDDRYLRRFQKQELTKTNGTVITSNILPKPVFYTVCEDPEKSYHYSGLPKPKENEREKMIPTTAPAPLPIKNN